MRSVLYLLTINLVTALAFWAYRENYATQEALQETSDLHRDMRAAHARLAVLKAEWAYLNRPERLRDLVDINFDRLGLLPMRAEQFGRVDEIVYPPVQPPLDIQNSISVSSDGEAGE